MKIKKMLKKLLACGVTSSVIISASPAIASDYENHWAKEAIVEWNEYEVVAGQGNGIFNPGGQVTRAELAAFMTRVFGLKDIESATKFTDIKTTDWYASDVAKVSAAGIMNGSGGAFNPKGYATREEVAATLVNAFKLTGDGSANFNDQNEISDWSLKAVNILASKEYVHGQPGNKFAPKSNITRAEVIQLLDNIVEEIIHVEGKYQENIDGNLVINTQGVEVDGIEIKENVYLAPGIEAGNITFKNTNILGDAFVSVSGKELIAFENVNIAGNVNVDADAPVELRSKNSKLKVQVKNDQHVTFAGDYSEIVIQDGCNVDFKASKVDNLVIMHDGDGVAKININEDTIINKLIAKGPITITGNGKIELLIVESNGVKSEIKPGKLEVKEGIDKPELPKTSLGGGGGNGGGNSGGNGGGNTGTVTPETNYIGFESISLIGEDNSTCDILPSIVYVSGNKINIDLNGVEGLKLPKVITSGKIKYSNLKVNDKISTVINLGKFGTIPFSDTVGENGVVNYQVREILDKLNDTKLSMIQDLKEYGLYENIEEKLQQFGLSLETNYLLDEGMDVERAIDKMNKILEYIDDNKDSKAVQGVIQQIKIELEEHSVSIDLANKVITGKLNLETEKLGKTEYSVTIKY